MTAGTVLNEFDGTPSTVISLSETITDGYVVGGNTVFDNSTDKWVLGLATIRIQDTFGAVPTTGKTIELHMVRGEIETGVDSSGDAAYAAIANSAAQIDTNGMEYVGSFVVDANDEDFKRQIQIPLIGIREARFYIKNNTGTTLIYSTNAITVKIEGVSYAPSAT